MLSTDSVNTSWTLRNTNIETQQEATQDSKWLNNDKQEERKGNGDEELKEEEEGESRKQKREERGVKTGAKETDRTRQRRTNKKEKR